MSETQLLPERRLHLVDVVDHLLDRGVTLIGQATISLAEVDLVHLRLQLLLSSVEGLRRAESKAAPAPLGLTLAPARARDEPEDDPARGLARLVLTLVELLRQLIERQALRRAEGGGLSEEQLERLGLALLDLEQKMVELRALFDLEEEDLNVDLGPLGSLL